MPEPTNKKDNAVNNQSSMDEERDRADSDSKAGSSGQSGSSGQESQNPETEEDTASGGAPEEPDK